MKPFWQSKTLWFNALYLVVIVASALGYSQFQPSAEVLEIGGILVAVINVVLRLVTEKKIGA